MSTVSERFVNNFVTIMVARLAMIATPVLLAFFWWAGSEMWANLGRRVSAVEAITAKQTSQIQDHESRLKFADEKASEAAGQIDRRFNDLGGSLKELNSQIGGINGAIIRLQTTIENRLPPRTAKVDQDDPAETGVAKVQP